MKRRTHMLHMLMLLFALFLPLITLADDEIFISSDTDWSTFADNIHNGTTFAGQIIKLTKDISVSAMVDGSFHGTLIGGGHTITVNLSGSGEYTALFKEINNATIQFLKVEGTVTTTGLRPATFASFVSGICTIKNCWSAAAISSTITNNWVDGGAFVARVNSGATLNLQDCAFTGTVTYANTAEEGGGMVGWTQDGAQAKLTRCLFAPSTITMKKTNDDSHLFVTGAVRGNLTDCYYNAIAKASILDKEGTDASNMSTFELVSTLNHNAEEWQVNGGGNVVPVMAHDPYNLQFAIVSGIVPHNIYTGSAISITPVVIAADGTVLTLGTDFTATLGTDDVTSFPFSVTNKGSYSLTLTGINSYSGTQTFNFKVFDLPDGLSLDDDYSVEQDGFYYVNMPKTSTKEINIPAGFTSSFKVYDDGGKDFDYSGSCSGTLVITAPTGYVLQLSGNITTQGSDYIHVYDGSNDSATKLLEHISGISRNVSTNIPIVISSGSYMTLYFSSEYASRDTGLDLTVTLVSPSTERNISISNPVAGGTISASATSITASQTVTLTASPTSGYLLSDLSVIDANNNHVPVNRDVWANTATFRMPDSDVTVTPTFTNNTSAANVHFVNMPRTGTKTVIIPNGVQSFKVYDDGGKDGKYSDWCKGYLTLTAPDGYVLQLTGSIITNTYDNLKVYDGINNQASILLDDASSSDNGVLTDIPVVMSSGRRMTLYFKSIVNNLYAGLNLTVAVVNPNVSYHVSMNNPASGGTATASPTTAKVNQAVTLTASPAAGYLPSGFIVTDANNSHVSINWDGPFSNTATFSMPGSNVTVAPTFNNNLTAEGGLYINLPATGSKTLNIPTGVQSFKIYDDGGEDGYYSYNCNGSLTLCAPEGYYLQLSGRIFSERIYQGILLKDYLDVFDNSQASGTQLLKEVTSDVTGIWKAIPVVMSSGRYMTIRFTSDDDFVTNGLDLTVKLIGANQSFNISANNPASGGTVAANLTSAKVNQTVTITASPDDGYLLSGISVTYDDNGSAPIDWKGPFFNTATFRTPSGNVTITPTFTNNLTAGGGLYANLPVTGNYTVTIPEGVQSFKVYDDGGKIGNYSNDCNGSVTLYAPEGCYLQLSGSMSTEDYNQIDHFIDYLIVYDNSTTSGTKLIDKMCSTNYGEWINVPTVESSGRYMTIYFHSNFGWNYSGLDLTVTVKYVPATITFAKEGYSTYYHSHRDMVLPAGMKAYIVTASDNGATLTYETIADGDTWNNRTVPAGTAVMLQTAASTTTQDIEVPLASPTAAAITQTNLLQGSDVAKTTTGDGKHYKLSYGASNGANANTLGWYWGTTNGAAFTSGAHKAWLALPTSYATREFLGLPDGDNETGLNEELRTPKGSRAKSENEVAMKNEESNAVYDLSGRKINCQLSTVNSQLPKGIYIKNGRKEVIK